jgi:7-cyano-7-deazaguanine synthase in queuosine biosynthesis
MNILALVSGGFDSTAMIHRALVDGHRVTPLYVSTIIHENQKKHEQQALKTILYYLSTKYGELISNRPTVLELGSLQSSKAGLQQPPLWLYGAFLESQQDITYDEVWVGYITEDHALSYSDEIKNLWKALNAFTPPFANKIPELKFPMMKWLKYDTINYVVEKMPEVFYAIQYCEFPKEDGTTCGTCHSCKKAEEAGLELFEAKAKNTLAYRDQKAFQLPTKRFTDLEKTWKPVVNGEVVTPKIANYTEEDLKQTKKTNIEKIKKTKEIFS